MYALGEQFKLNIEDAKALDASIIKGKKYRITILTDNMYRFEYNEKGIFNDLPTELVRKRNFPKPEFAIKQDENYLEITTKYVQILYSKEKNYEASKVNPAKNLSVKINNTDRFWYYGHPEARNIGAPGYEIPFKNIGKVNKLSDLKIDRGLFSFDGFVSLDDSKSMIIDASGNLEENNGGLDVYLIVYLDDFSKCLKNYYELTGYPSLIPRFALGNCWYKNEAYDDTSIVNLVNDFRNNHIPISAIMLNNDWHVKAKTKKYTLDSGFTFDNTKFKSPKLLTEFLHKQGIHLGIPVNPFDGFYPTETFYAKALTYLDEKDGHIPFNVLDPKTLDVYLKLFIHPLEAYDIDFYTIDYYNPKNINSLSYLKHFEYLDLDRNYKKRPMLVSNNTSLASHRYSILKSPAIEVGWDALKLVNFYNLMATGSGITWWAHDIGGYTKGIEEDELYTRFVELGVFSPLLKLSSDKGKYYKREPWKWSIKTNTIVEDFLNLRHRLIPYLYSEAYKYSKDGIPVIKPLFYDVPNLYDDEIYYKEYYFGSELLISPIIKKKEIVMNRNIEKIYMPEGTWYDFFSGKKFPGGREYVSFYREQDYPVFAHAGSIIPLGTNPNINDTNPPKDMEIHIFPGKSNVYHLYEDDGVSGLYKKDYYLLTDIDYNYMPNNYTVIIRAIDGKSGIVPDHRNYKLIFRNTKKADEVIVYSNDVKMEYKSYVNGPDFIVEIENAKTLGQITVNCKGKDIEIDALRIINTDIERILSDLQIPTVLKEKIDSILFNDSFSIGKKRIEIRKLHSAGLESKFIKLFLRLLEYINQV